MNSETKGFWFLMFACIDAFLTFIGLGLGYTELNPVFNQLIISVGLMSALIFKIFISSIICFVIYIKPQKETSFIHFIRNSLLLSYVIVCMSNILVLL